MISFIQPSINNLVIGGLTMKKILILFCCLFALLITMTQTSFAQEETSSEEEEEEIVGDPETIEFLIGDLQDVQDDLLSEFEDTKIKALRQVSTKIKGVIKFLERAIESIEEDEAESCHEDLDDSLGAFERVLDKLEAKSCDADKPPKKCIPEDLAEDFLIDLENLFDELDGEASIDDNGDGIADVCGSI